MARQGRGSQLKRWAMATIPDASPRSLRPSSRKSGLGPKRLVARSTRWKSRCSKCTWKRYDSACATIHLRGSLNALCCVCGVLCCAVVWCVQVRDLVAPVSFDYRGLQVRDNPQLGTWVQGLEPNVVSTVEELHDVRCACCLLSTVEWGANTSLCRPPHASAADVGFGSCVENCNGSVAFERAFTNRASGATDSQA